MITVEPITLPHGIRVLRLPISNESGSICDRCGRWHWHIRQEPVHLRPVLTFESGFVWAPYIPKTKGMPSMEELTLRRGVDSRYGKKLANPEWFGFINIGDLID